MRTAAISTFRQWVALSLFLVLTLGLPSAVAADKTATPPALRAGDRIVLVGDSITGLSQNHAAGFAHLIRKALAETFPANPPTVTSLGGSGQSVASWGNVERESRQKDVFLDVKGINVKTTLDGGADVLVIMLGMNDVLAPYISPDPKALDHWVAGYRDLAQTLEQRVHPRILALGTVTPCSENPNSPRNRILAQMNQRVAALAQEKGWLLLPTGQTVLAVLQQGRQANPAFHVTGDYVHPNVAGHLGIAIGMLRGLGQSTAADHLNQQVTKLIAALPPATPAKAPPAWLIGTGLIQGWNGEKFDFDANRTAVDDAIEKNADFTGPIAVNKKDEKLTWQPYVPSVDFTGGAAPGSIDFTAVAFGQTFESAYAARWIFSPAARTCELRLRSQTFAGDSHLAAWLNGKSVYREIITRAPGKQATITVELQPGWNVLVLKSNHRTWQWQVAADLLSAKGEDLPDLRYESHPPVTATSPK
ncbi:MAG: GDSL-type esterase/lipase family protein [Phycisphaerae bacterium]